MRWHQLAPLLLGLSAACGAESSEPDGGVLDRGVVDAGTPVDAGPIDTGAPDRSLLMEARLEEVQADPDALEAFLRAFPKGADLHTHLTGTPRAERMVEWGAEDGLCVSRNGLVARNCSGADISLTTALTDMALMQRIVAAWSVEGFQGTLLQRHAHFFSTFGRFRNITDTRHGDMIIELRRTAAVQNVSYVEPMVGLQTWRAANLSSLIPTNAWDANALETGRAAVVAEASFVQAIADTRAFLDMQTAYVDGELGCGTAAAEAACGVEVRYIVQTRRAVSREVSFAEFIYGFELAKADPRVVGVNMVQAEESTESLTHYEDHMTAIGFLVTRGESLGEPEVKVALHAGELIPEVLPANQQDHVRYHIRRAVEVARAHRIGHGADILLEDEGPGRDPDSLMADMAARGVLVEVCLTSNDQLLGLKGATHPLTTYVERGVPVALATDDEGVLRTELTTEFRRAVEEHAVRYAGLVQMARDSLEHAFVEGESLWVSRSDLSPVAVCEDAGPSEPPPADCATFLSENPRAQLQWDLEADLWSFETAQLQ